MSWPREHSGRRVEGEKGGFGCRSCGWPAVGSACTPEVRRARRAVEEIDKSEIDKSGEAGRAGKVGGRAHLRGGSCLGLSPPACWVSLGVLGKFGRAG